MRIGCVQYLNAQPLIHGWPSEVHFEHPAALCRMLAEGELDVALVSSFEFLRNPIYSIVDDVCVAADGPVFSVFVAHRARVENASEITADPNSLTSVNLLRCLLAERGWPAQVVDGEADAKLLIGDQAIRFREVHGSQYDYWDLAAEWKHTTGLPFVFALWLIRPGTPDASTLAQRLRQLRDRNLATLDEVIAAQPGFAPEFCNRYFRQHLRFHFGEAEKHGLLRFRLLCEKHALLPRDSKPWPFL
ncbi:MAG: menaquinone biosynthesis protein [Chthoniobacterales bacterium]